MRTTFVAVFSNPVTSSVKEAILAEARKSWPFVRLPREDIHFPYHAHFSSHNCAPGRFENQSDFEQAVNDAAALQRDLPEWTRQFPLVTFALVDVDCDEDWRFGGYVCKCGNVSLRRECEEEPHFYDLLERVHLNTEHCDPLDLRYFGSVNDLKSEALAELDVVREYVRIMKTSLAEEWNRYEAASEDHLYPGWHEDLDDPFDYLNSFHRTVENKRKWYQSTLTQELRCSVFVSSYSLLEQNLVHICKYLDRHQDQVSPLVGKVFATTGGKGIFRAKNYLQAVVPPSFFDTSLHWKEILKYNKIRNWIVHNGREIEVNRHSAELVRIVAPRHDIHIRDGELELTGAICDAATSEMQLLFCELTAVLPKV